MSRVLLSASALSTMLATLVLFIAAILLTRQTQIPMLGGLAAPFAVFIVLVGLDWTPRLAWLLPITAFALASAAAGVALGHEVDWTARFFAITLATLLAFFVKPRPINSVALVPLGLQALLIAGISLWLTIEADPTIAAGVRSLALESEWGDVYTTDGLYFKVQLIGNALLPLLFLVSYWKYSDAGSYRWLTWISLAGLIAAGNASYLLVAFIAVTMRHGARLHRRLCGKIALGLSIPALLAASMYFAQEIIAPKFGGGDSSMGIRFDQIDAAIEAFDEYPTKALLGAGLGATFPDGRQRSYSQFQYIELQALYFFYQLGLIGALLYLGTLIIALRNAVDSHGRQIFWLYMLASSTNPYFLDTNQVVVTLFVICLFPRQKQSVQKQSVLMKNLSPVQVNPSLSNPWIGSSQR